jgi:tetratricopeptide (TPR) repeat protein
MGGIMANAAGASADDIVFRDKSGRVLTQSDLAAAAGAVDWEIRSTAPVSAEAQALHAKGRAAGQTGDSVAALGYFAQAAELAPDWPYPVYDAAFTYLLQRDFKTAYAYYQRVDAMAPRGFFTVKTAVDTLAKEAAGTLPEGLYLYLVSLEWQTDPAKKYQALVEMTEKFPQYAPAWKERAVLETDDDKQLLAIDNGLRGDPDAETRGYLLVNKALLLNRRGERDAAIAMLGELALDPASPGDIELIAKKTIDFILKGQAN